MAFVSKGMASLTDSGVLLSILPAALLDNRTGQEWREQLAAQADVLLLGRFRGYGYFRGSSVEPGFVSLRRRRGRGPTDALTRMVIADDGAEDAALRALRRHNTLLAPPKDPGWEVFDVPLSNMSPASWLPRQRSHAELLGRLADLSMPRLGQLFHVYQGVRTGLKTTLFT
jgi:hypothetical protein